METLPKECPNCKANEVDIKTIQYGLPVFDTLDFSKNIVLGGCIIRDDSPKWHCTYCSAEWGAYHEHGRPPNKITFNSRVDEAYDRLFASYDDNKNIRQRLKKSIWINILLGVGIISILILRITEG